MIIKLAVELPEEIQGLDELLKDLEECVEDATGLLVTGSYLIANNNKIKNGKEIKENKTTSELMRLLINKTYKQIEEEENPNETTLKMISLINDLSSVKSYQL